METTYKNHSDYDSLSPQAKMLLKKCHEQTMLSPLEACRVYMEDATIENYMAWLEVETYLIYEE